MTITTVSSINFKALDDRQKNKFKKELRRRTDAVQSELHTLTRTPRVLSRRKKV